MRRIARLPGDRFTGMTKAVAGACRYRRWWPPRAGLGRRAGRRAAFAVLAGVLSAWIVVPVPANESRVIRLDNGFDLRLTTILPSRGLPHTYYDQAMSSIPVLYPGAQVIAGRRAGFLAAAGAWYSVVCYSRYAGAESVVIEGVVVGGGGAWSFGAEVPLAELAGTLLLVLEELSRRALDRGALPSPHGRRD